jgi:hypothetical protein
VQRRSARRSKRIVDRGMRDFADGRCPFEKEGMAALGGTGRKQRGGWDGRKEKTERKKERRKEGRKEGSRKEEVERRREQNRRVRVT